MTTREPVRAVILALLAAVLFATSADAQRIGSTYVFDGDTVAIGGTRARIWGIDAPDQPLGMKKAAGDYLARAIEAEGGVTCAFPVLENQAMRRARAPACPSPLTNHDRIVTSCRFRRSGEDVGERMTSAGYAVDWRGSARASTAGPSLPSRNPTSGEAATLRLAGGDDRSGDLQHSRGRLWPVNSWEADHGRVHRDRARRRAGDSRSPVRNVGS